jgi:hypothetical protein
METNYKVKHRRILMPLKLMLLLVAIACFGFTSYAQQGEGARVSNFQQLEQALENPLVGYVIIDESFQGPVDRNHISGYLRAQANGGNRAFECAYAIIDNDTCFFDPADDPPWVYNTAAAYAIDLGSGDCPEDDDGAWLWNLVTIEILPPPGASLEFTSSGPPYTSDTTEFRVDHAGVYTLRYTWGAPWNSYAQTEYKFYSPFVIEELFAPDVCGLETWVDLEISAYYGDPDANIYYYLWNPCTGQQVSVSGPELDTLWYFDHTSAQIPKPIDNDTVQSEYFMITAPDYGNWKFIVQIDDGQCAMVADTIDIVFAIEPVADAGENIEVCYDRCWTLIGSAGSMFYSVCYQAPNFAYSWVQLSGPTELIFDPFDAETTYVCGTTDCWYGEYEVEFQVQNGLCYDSDIMVLTFYQQPEADAGRDQYICDDLCFTLGAMPFSYCSDELDDERWYKWQWVSSPNDCGDNLVPGWDDEIPNPFICVDDQRSCCPYGEYKFEWIEVNGTCEDRDTVSIFLYEKPIADAGPDSITECFYEGCFTVYGQAYAYCSDTVGNRWHSWEVTAMPDGVMVDANEEEPYMFVICPEGECIWGEYEVVLTESNDDVCIDTDTIHFYLFEPTTADAGEDFTMCYYGGCFSMGALPFSYCSDPAPDWGDRYGEWTKVSGPAMVEFNPPTDPDADACPDEEDDCVFGIYTFKWSEYNGDCMDEDLVKVTLFEPPTAEAGESAEYCVEAEFSWNLWHTFAAVPHSYCQEEGLEAYSYWSKCGGPGYVTWYNEQNNPYASVHVSCFGCYCFEYVEVNGDCESRDTTYVCWYEHPVLPYPDLYDSTCTVLCFDLGKLGIVPYEYGECENYNNQSWNLISGSGNVVSFTPDSSDAQAEVCVDQYGCYVFDFIQFNGMLECADTVRANLWFFEDPIADAGDDAEICGPCYIMSAMPYSYVQNECHPAEDAYSQWVWFSYIPPDQYCGFGDYSPCLEGISQMDYPFTFDDPDPEICVCDDYYGTHYGMYGFIYSEFNGPCEDHDTVWITYNKLPDPLPISGCTINPECEPVKYKIINGVRDVLECGCAECWYPEDTVMTVCAGDYINLCIDWDCFGYDAIEGYTYEWSFTGPAGSSFQAYPYYYDCECGWTGSYCVEIHFGECCDTARLYLTITTQEGCVTTEEWKFYVQHPPDATITGPDIAEVSSIYEYYIPDELNPCYLYVWEVEHCGEIVYGQGTGRIGVHWTDYNENGGWGLVSVGVWDTCTCCCGFDEMLVRVLPQGSLGEDTLRGHVYYENASMTPLNGVKLTLWNADVPIFETYSFNDIEGGNGVGYYEFADISDTTEFGLTGEYMAPWISANSTDALAIELQVATMGGYTWTDVQWEAGDVNASGTLSATDALWVKQRAIMMVNFFPAGDWAFADMNTYSGVYDVMTLNYGDVNHSNIPYSGKDMPAITLVNDGTINVKPGDVFDLPIRVADAVSLGAITLNLGYNSNLLEVVEVNAVEGALTHFTSTNIALAWSDVNPMVLNNNDAIFSLRLKALDQITASDQLFSIELGTEFADPAAIVLEDVTLKAFGISTDPAAADYFLSYNRPNPFSTSTMIEYALPENGKVRLSVVDLLGQDIAVLIDQSQSAGSYTVQFNAAGLTPGVYIYKITVQGETRDFVETKRMVISH